GEPDPTVEPAALYRAKQLRLERAAAEDRDMPAGMALEHARQCVEQHLVALARDQLTDRGGNERIVRQTERRPERWPRVGARVCAGDCGAHCTFRPIDWDAARNQMNAL